MTMRQIRYDGRIQARIRSGAAVMALAAFVLTPVSGTAAMANEAKANASQSNVLLALADDVRSFDLPAGPLDRALVAFGSQSGLQVAIDSAAVAGKSVPAVDGTMTGREALQRLLTGSGLVSSYTSTNAVSIAAAGEGATILSPIMVEGEGESPYGPVKGFVATRSASGMKTNTALIETPQSISVITAGELKSRNVNKFNDMLRYTPGVESELYGLEPRFSHLSMRGLVSSTTGLFKDGMGMVNPGFVVSYNPEPWGAERIEVPRGPASVLYGQGSPGGLINYISKRPTTERFGLAHVETGNHNRKQVKFDLGGAVDEEKKLAFRLAGLLRRSDTQIDYLEDDRKWFAPSLSWQPVNSTNITFFGMYQEDDTQNSQALPGKGTRFENPNGSVPHSRYSGEPNLDQYHRTEFSAGYELEHEANKDLNLRHNVRYHVVNLNDDIAYGSGFDGNRTLSRTYYSNHGNMKSLTADTNAEFKTELGETKHTLLGGVDIQAAIMETVQRSASITGIDVFTPTYGASLTSGLSPVVLKEFTKTQYGVYAQDQIEFGDHWRFNIGGRYDWAMTDTNNIKTNTESTQRDRDFTGRAGVVYMFDNGFAPYASYAESFLPVTDSSNAQGDFFEPETGRQYEVGLKYQPPGYNSFVTVSAFDLRRQNYTQYDNASMSTVQTGEVRSQGIEVEGLASFDFGLDIKAGYTYLQAEVLKSIDAAEIGKQLTQIPEHKATLWADYTFPRGMFEGIGFGAGVRYQGKHYGDSKNTLTIPGYTLFDAAAHYETDKFRFGLNAQNVLDQEHLGSCYFRNTETLCTVGEGLMVTANVSYEW